jgi:type II secretory pathway component GspD/PulD (secretin)
MVSALLIVLGLAMGQSSVESLAQQPNPPSQGIPIQLPTVSSFQINTVVMAPDAGATRLGGVARGASGMSSAGVPLLSNVPGINPLFRNQAFGSSYSAAQSSVHVKLIIHSEIEEELLAEAERRIATRLAIDPNGSAAVQKRAAFLSRNIGRK